MTPESAQGSCSSMSSKKNLCASHVHITLRADDGTTTSLSLHSSFRGDEIRIIGVTDFRAGTQLRAARRTSITSRLIDDVPSGRATFRE